MKGYCGYLIIREGFLAIVEEVLKETGVSFVPGWGFGSTGKKAIRISFGPLVEDVQKIEKGLARVEKYLKNE